MTQLRQMFLDGCGRLERLPSAMQNLTQLTSISLTGCESLAALPQVFLASPRLTKNRKLEVCQLMLHNDAL